MCLTRDNKQIYIKIKKNKKLQCSQWGNAHCSRRPCSYLRPTASMTFLSQAATHLPLLQTPTFSPSVTRQHLASISFLESSAKFELCWTKLLSFAEQLFRAHSLMKSSSSRREVSILMRLALTQGHRPPQTHAATRQSYWHHSLQ